jgi:hypothetical protein
MEARIRLSKEKTTSGIRVMVELTYVPVNGEVAQLAESLGYKKLAFDNYVAYATTPAELDAIRNPMIELMKKGLIVDGSNVRIG